MGSGSWELEVGVGFREDVGNWIVITSVAESRRLGGADPTL